MDINYDGYYDDVKPVDAGEQEEGVDPEMVKKGLPFSWLAFLL